MTPTRSSPSATAAAAATATTTTGGEDRICYYKGKHTNRSWQHLPPELVRSIATHLLIDLQSSHYTPLTWDAKELWHPRIVYTTLRDALDLERIMQVTPAWAAALETHFFWSKACTVIDPHSVLAQFTILRPKPPPPGSPLPLHHQSPYRHFRQITTRSCYVCRINAPYTSAGLANVKRTFQSLNLGTITLCREHRKSTFCGLCLREAPPNECDPPHPLQQQPLLSALQVSVPIQPFQTAFDVQTGAMRFVQQQQHHQLPPHFQPTTAPSLPFNPALMVCCAENEDDETWPGIETTCRSCRNEWLWQRISSSARDREAVGGPRFGAAVFRSPSARSHSHVAKAGRRRSDSSRSSHHTLDSINDNNADKGIPMLLTRSPPFKYASPDWETRQTVDAFIDLGEGSISEVIGVAREKFWLRKETKMVALMEQAVAATRWAGGEIGADVVVGGETGTGEVAAHQQRGQKGCSPSLRSHASSPYEEVASQTTSPNSHISQAPRAIEYDHNQDPSSDVDVDPDLEDLEEEEEEEDPELLSLTEDAGGIRDLSISDWARTRILDGHWVNPADQWYGHAWPAGGGVRDVGEETESEPDLEVNSAVTVDVGARIGGRKVRRVRAVHPCPWTVAPSTSNASSFSEGSLSANPNADGDLDPNSNHEDTRDEKEQQEEEDIHPRMSIVRSHAPPSFSLCEQAYRAYQKQLRDILLPAMVNLVRKIVVEAMYGVRGWSRFDRDGGCERSSPDGVGRGQRGVVDPAVKVARMGMEEVLEGLRQPGVWFEGYDWVALALPSSTSSSSPSSSPSEPGGNTKFGGETTKTEEREEDTNSSTSDRSDTSSHTTSPVLSTTTLQTTPSPPPARGQLEKRGGKVIPPPRVPRPAISTRTTSPSVSGSVTSATGTDASPNTATATGTKTPKPTYSPPIPISPTLARPRLLHPIPYIPVTLAFMPQFSLEAFRMAWREACAPLFHCRCSICERAILNANANANVGTGNTNTNAVSTQQQQQAPAQNVRHEVYQDQHHHQQQQCPPQVVLEEVQLRSHPEVVAHEEEEEEEEYYEEEEEEEEEEEGEEGEEESEEEDEQGDADADPPPLASRHDHGREHAVTPKKRSCGDLDAENQTEEGAGVPRVGTPPKRARMGAVVVSGVLDVSSVTPLPTHKPEAVGSDPVATANTATPRQRKRSSEELEVSGDGGGQTDSTSSADNHADPMQMGSLQKRLRVEPASAATAGVGGRDRKTSTPRSLSTTPPSSVTAVSSSLPSPEEDRGSDDRKKTRGRGGCVDVSMQRSGGAGVVKTGLVMGGELDGLYVFEEV
ncbi:hypothetical protein BKA82DRAFT_21257 [Pisolithus tinctorius]|uniref:Uncharacterized protein n=1 Tax=Pisolithus tinctorius Marx 270 TaxID=870435 RepID=A0A0C3PN74_PISTI|nr:hypothetical protein BKA82DRAFT_21257 [Pisolithus tinctorius]KIO10281.1 hypothetical protein M404DRAFT_21257 [Pisolithus tinctorius Marx 270]